MGVGVGLILIAVGAILAWAVNVDTTGFNVNTVGYILLDRRDHRGHPVDDLLVELGGPRLLRRRPQTTNDRSRGRRLVHATYGSRAAGIEPPPDPPKTHCIPTLEPGTQKIRRFATGAVS